MGGMQRVGWLRLIPAVAMAAVAVACAATNVAPAMPTSPSVSSLFLLSDAQSRSISPENLTGGKGMGGRTPLEQGSAKAAAAKLGTGWKVNPYINIAPGESFTMGEADGPGHNQSHLDDAWRRSRISLGDPAHLLGR